MAFPTNNDIMLARLSGFYEEESDDDAPFKRAPKKLTPEDFLPESRVFTPSKNAHLLKCREIYREIERKEAEKGDNFYNPEKYR